MSMEQNLRFRPARESDADTVARIYDEARQGFRVGGIPQWQEGVPNRDTFLADVRSGTARVLLLDGAIAATCQLVTYEPSYDVMEGGTWSTDDYVAVHRVAVDPTYRRRGLAGIMLREAEAYARSLGKSAVRIDTHELNVNMRAMLQKNGYVLRGRIHLADGSPRVAYEKKL